MLKPIKILFLSLTFCSVMLAQPFGYGDANLLRVGLHTGNRVGISFHNDGQIAGILSGVDIRGEWPFGSGENYIGDMIPLIGVEFINTKGDTIHSVIISRGPRNRQSEERHPTLGYFWGWNPRPGFVNPNQSSVAMSHLPDSWPQEGWADTQAINWKDKFGRTEWFGYFGRGIINADQESIFDADDQNDDQFNFDNLDPNVPIFLPDASNPNRHGMGLKMRLRGFQWSNFLAEDAIFWLYDITNEGTYIYRKANFGTVVGTLAGGDGDSGDDLGFFDVDNWITYSWDSDNKGNKGQKVGYVGYAFLESPGNSYDGIDNDDDSKSNSPRFVSTDFGVTVYNTGSIVVLIDPITYERTFHTVGLTTDTVFSLGVRFVIQPGVTQFREGQIGSIVQGVSIPDISAYDGIDNDLDGLIDENQAIHFTTRFNAGLPGVSYKNYRTGSGLLDPLIDEKRDNSIDEDGDWNVTFDDLGEDGKGPGDNEYSGPDQGEGNGIPDQGEPNFGITDPDESDQIGLTGFNFFNLTASPDMTNDTLLWGRMTPGRFDVIPPIPQDGDFIYSSGFFPMVAKGTERFSVSILMGEDYSDIVGNKNIVQQIYNAGYKFPQPPRKPTITLSQEDGKVVIYWDGTNTENDRDFITKVKDFEGYKIYRASDANFSDARVITNGMGILTFDKPIVQYDIVDSVAGFFYPSQSLLTQVGGITYYLGANTGVVNRFVDSTVTLGMTYYYAVCSFDKGDASRDIFPSENSKFIRRASSGEIITDVNTGFITPGRRPAGYEQANFTNLVKSPSFKGTGRINIEIVDDNAIKDGYSYKVAFVDTGSGQQTAYWSLIDLQSPDTVYVPLEGKTYIVNPEESISLPAGTDTIFVNNLPFKVTGTNYTAAYDSLVNLSSIFNGNTGIRHGFRMQIFNDAVVKLDTAQSENSGFTSTPTSLLFNVYSDPSFPINNGVKFPNDYEVEFFPEIVGNSVADTLFPARILPSVPINFKVKNLNTDQFIDVAYSRANSLLTTSYTIIFKEDLNGVKKRTWSIILSYTAGAAIEQTGKMKIVTTKPFGRTDELTFKMNGAKLNTETAKNDMDLIKVVPNPYVVTHEGESRLLSTQSSGRGEREIRFTHIPPGSVISIYTVRGEKIKTLSTSNLYMGDVYWNLRTDENIDVAFGVYVYIVETPGSGSKIGKFALIK